MALSGKVALVTGASRGIGKGIALQLSAAGATVYITGRTLQAAKDADFPGSLMQTADEICARGGSCIPVQCDHAKDDQIDEVFRQIEMEQGRLDILVNNAFSGAAACIRNLGKPFWERPETFWDDINNIGLRNHYICSVKAAKMMVKQKSGLIVMISSIGAIKYSDTPAYGIGKAACDRMAADCALELKAHNVAYISLWPGPVSTEVMQQLAVDQKNGKLADKGQGVTGSVVYDVAEMLKVAESPEFSGKCIVALATDTSVMDKTGEAFSTAALGKEYHIVDIDGRRIEEFSFDEA
ncbi:dehydrogenase/reductase SDR family member 1-like [Paramacrobiotus metropolitanus]|uniref:dehydrogenase/reductase SDR family member 1-like n=1 Tax=Paramacrobiotus metropolitanus TaxID=2943436 RepID=UPI0024460F6E|nr:dehydrogenase/reductase SDR family member 1-like [Paramacrobiotus metropolitanus]